MNYRNFGKTDLRVSEIGFGAWGIGGPAMVGETPIGWGQVDDRQSIRALEQAFDRGINFYDTADFYGFGHSEEIIGQAFGNRSDVIIATKVGQRLADEKTAVLDYSKKYVLEACEASLRRLKREVIDYYQLHVAKLPHLENGECLEAMEILQQQGKIRHWGISVHTFNPFPEAEFMLKHKLGAGFQLVFNIINQRAFDLMQRMHREGYGVIARMALQFGLLTGKISEKTKFPENDHRHLRLKPDFIKETHEALAPVWERQEAYGISKTAFSLSFVLSFPEVSTVIPGIKTPEQAIQNTSDIIQLKQAELDFIRSLYPEKFVQLVDWMEQTG